MSNLGAVFQPDTVAVIGATERSGSVGRAIFENLTREFVGTVIPVNPNRDTVFGTQCYPSIAEAPPVELVIITVPPAAAIETLEAAGEKGIPAAVIITAGFGETDTAGADREQRLQEIATTYEMTVIGPNSLGVMNTRLGLNATFGPSLPTEGSIALMSQSGAFITAAIEWARDRRIGFSHVLSLGNEAVVDETALLEYWGQDEDTDAILAYLEAINRGRAFIETARSVTTDTPIVVVKAGRSDAGAQAAASHTGSIAGSDRVYEAAFKQAGVLRVDTATALFDTAAILQGNRAPTSSTVAVVTNAGGPGVLATDAIAETEATVATLRSETTKNLEDQLPGRAEVTTPVDVLGDADAERICAATRTVAADPSVGVVLVVTAPTAVLSQQTLIESLREVDDAVAPPIVACLMGGENARGAATTLQGAGIPAYADPHQAVMSIERLLQTTRSRPDRSRDERSISRNEQAAAIIERALNRNRRQLGGEAIELLSAYGIETPVGELVGSPEAATAATETIGEPVVMKVISPEVVHKSDIGGVETGVTVDTAAETYNRLQTRMSEEVPEAPLEGILVQKQVDTTNGTEMIMGAKRDPQFGQVVLFGRGGIFVEVFDDTAVRVGPLNETAATAMIDEIEAAPLLRGARGRPPADEAAVVDALLRLSQLVENHPEIREVDVNPLLVTETGTTALDLRVSLDATVER